MDGRDDSTMFQKEKSKMSAEYRSRLLERVLVTSCLQAEQILEMHGTDSAAFERTIAGLELSPLVDKQLIAAALRLACDLGLSGGIRASLLHRFRSPAPGVAVEGHRRAIERDVMDKGLPMELAGDYVDTLQRRIAVPEHELPEALWEYAAIYDDLWSDPRIGAETATRRIMLAMATVLRARSAQLSAARARGRAPAIPAQRAPSAKGPTVLPAATTMQPPLIA